MQGGARRQKGQRNQNRRERGISLYIWGNIGGDSQRIPQDYHFRVDVVLVRDTSTLTGWMEEDSHIGYYGIFKYVGFCY